jgi:hypothetical protein
MRRRGHGEGAIRKVVYDNPLAFFRQCHRWQPWDREAAQKADGDRPAAAPAAAPAGRGY